VLKKTVKRQKSLGKKNINSLGKTEKILTPFSNFNTFYKFQHFFRNLTIKLNLNKYFLIVIYING